MKSKIKVLIADENEEFGRLSGEILEKNGFDVITAIGDGLEVVDAVIKNNPDVAIIGVTLKNLDGIGVLRRLKEGKAEVITKFIITSNISNTFMQREASEEGAAYFLTKPFDFMLLCERIRRIAFENEQCKHQYPQILSEGRIEYEITEVLHKVGVPAHIKGYYYLREAIFLAIKDVTYLNQVTKRLYPEVAEKHDTTSSRVERAIRHSIEVAWERGDVEAIEYYFGGTINNLRGKPTNSEFIALVADSVRLKRNAM